MLPEWKLVRGETLKIRKKKATFAIIFISIFIIIGIVTFSYLRLKSSRESAAVSCIEEDIKKGSVSGKNREKLESYLRLFPVHQTHTAVNDRLFNGLQAFLAADHQLA